jgi:hypothetical protein
MKKKIIGIFFCMMLAILVSSISVCADPGAKLEIKIYGGFPILFGMDNVGGAIGNTGDTTAYDVSFSFSVIGGFANSIDYTYEDFWGDLIPNQGIGVVTSQVHGLGPVTITLSATSSNADDVIETAKGFQIGSFTWVPFSWLKSDF